MKDILNSLSVTRMQKLKSAVLRALSVQEFCFWSGEE